MKISTFSTFKKEYCIKKSIWAVALGWLGGSSKEDMLLNKIHQVLGSCWFLWCGFHLCAFSKHSPNIQIMQFSLHRWRNSFTLAFWLRIWFMQILFRPKETHELRTRCMLLITTLQYVYWNKNFKTETWFIGFRKASLFSNSVRGHFYIT